MANPNPVQSEGFKNGRFKKGHIAGIANRRNQLTWEFLKKITKENVDEILSILLTEIRTPGRNRLKAIDTFAKIAFKSHQEDLVVNFAQVPVTQILRDSDINNLIEEDNDTD